ncbi:hypothetical protein Tco_1390001, partial [Tanacetum coccineum]
YLNDLEEEYQARALLAKSKRFFKKGTKRFSSAKATDQTECYKCRKKYKLEPKHTKDFEAKYNKVKAKPALLSSSASAPSSSSSKNKCLIAEKYDWYEEEVSSDDNEVTEVKALMALTDEEKVFVGKESANNGEWVKISIQKVHTLLEMEDNNDRKSFLDYLCIDLNYVEEQRNNLLSKHRNLVHELNTCKEQLLVLKQAKLDLLTMQHCISEQILTQKRKILGIDQLIEDTSSSGPKDLVFVRSSADNSEVSITCSNKPKLSETEDSTLSNHDTGKLMNLQSIAPLLPLLEKLTGAEPVSGLKTIKSILKSKSTFKAETLKGITINEPSSTLARGNKSSSVSKTNSAPAETRTLNRKRDTLQAKKAESFKASKTESSNALRSKTPTKSNVHTTSDHNDIEWFRKREALQAKKAESFKASNTESSNALRSKTPTKRSKGYGYGIVFKKRGKVNVSQLEH